MRRRLNPPIGQTQFHGRPIAVFMAGPPGAGKSSYVQAMDFGPLGFVIVEADRFIESHPDYDPKAPERLYPWAKAQAERQLVDVMYAGAPFVYDGSGAYVEKMVRHIEDARAAGYYTFVVYVRVPLDIALDRNRRRARSVPETVITDKAAMVEEAIRILTSYADDIEVIDNMTPESRDRSIRQYDEVYRERTAQPGLGAPWRSARVNPRRRLWLGHGR